LSAPLPQRAQERLDREAAYEQTKQEVDKWSDTMKQIREVCSCIEFRERVSHCFLQAEHLSFPLQTQSSGKPSNLELTAKFKVNLTCYSNILQSLIRPQADDRLRAFR
jgi:U3 small nucleolar RNA-associated protein 14